jgi:hypothetical protein
LAQSGHSNTLNHCPLLGKADIGLTLAQCPLLTQSGHERLKIGHTLCRADKFYNLMSGMRLTAFGYPVEHRRVFAWR